MDEVELEEVAVDELLGDDVEAEALVGLLRFVAADFFLASCASKPLSGTGHCKTRRGKAKRDLSCTKGVKRRPSELGAGNQDQQGREWPMSGNT